MKAILIVAFVLGVVAASVQASYCPLRAFENCGDFWGGNAEPSNNEAFWSFYSCAGRGQPANKGSPCYDTSMIRELAFADPSLTESGQHYTEAELERLFSLNGEDSLGFWNEIQREGQINRPRTENWGHIGHIALFTTGSGKPFLVNHGNLPFTRQRDGMHVENVVENLAGEARWSVCLTNDCAEVTEPRLFTAEEDVFKASKQFATYFNWNPCGQSSAALLMRDGQQVLTFVGVGSRSSWTDGRVVMAQCTDADCSDVEVIEVGQGLRDLPNVEHQCLDGYRGVGARIAVGADGNPSIVWRNKANPTELIYLHCMDTRCSQTATPSIFTLPNEAAAGEAGVWWDVVSSERGVWLLSSGSSESALPYGRNLSNTYIQVVSCDNSTCHGDAAAQFPQSSSDSSFGWTWQTNGDSVTFMAQTFAAGISGDGYPMWVGQAERGPQSAESWVVCSCRNEACKTPVCHFLADSNSIMDPAVSQCATLQAQPQATTYSHMASRHRILSGTSNGLPIIVQQISSVCVEIVPDRVANLLGSTSSNRLFERLHEFNSDSSSTAAFGAFNLTNTTFGTERRILLQSQKTLYINCLDATCSEASVSALESPRAASVSHETSYNQVDSTVLGTDQVLTVYSPDATADEQSYSWSSSCYYEAIRSYLEPVSGGDILRFSALTNNLRPTDGEVIFNQLFQDDGSPYNADSDAFTFDNQGNFIIAEFNGATIVLHAIDFDGNEQYHYCLTPSTNYELLSMTYDTDAELLLVAVLVDNSPSTVEVYQFDTPQQGDCSGSTTTGGGNGLLASANLDESCFGGSFTAGITTVPIAGDLLRNAPTVDGFSLGTSVIVMYGFCSDDDDDYVAAFSRRIDDTSSFFSWIFNSAPDSFRRPLADLAWDAVAQQILVTFINGRSGRHYLELSPLGDYNDFPVRISFGVERNLPNIQQRIKFRKSEGCSPSNNPSFDGAVLGGLSAVASVPNYVLLREFLGITPTPRTGGIKTWLTNRWSSPNGAPCEESQAAKLVAADDVVFLCTGVQLGNAQRWGTSTINGWTRFWEWQDISWGLRWRWQGDVHFGTDHSAFGELFYPDAESYNALRSLEIPI